MTARRGFSSPTGRDYFPGPDRIATTDEQGRFRIVDLPTDQVQLNITAKQNLLTVSGQRKADEKRQYLTGLSMGGYGTWSFAAANPDRWAAIAPICGGGNPDIAKKIKDIPCWNFHGDADKSVNVEQSRKLIAALKEAGGNPIYTEYPGVGHNSWDKAYGTDELYKWLLEQKKK